MAVVVLGVVLVLLVAGVYVVLGTVTTGSVCVFTEEFTRVFRPPTRVVKVGMLLTVVLTLGVAVVVTGRVSIGSVCVATLVFSPALRVVNPVLFTR